MIETLDNEPTDQGTLPKTLADVYTLSEIEAIAKKATRGAGWYWGLTEEAGKAARWLAGYGLPGAELLAQLLENDAPEPGLPAQPSLVGKVWRVRHGLLCPIVAGVLMSDRGETIAAGKPQYTGPTALPLLASISMAPLALGLGISVRVSWDRTSLLFTPDSLVIDGPDDDLIVDLTESVRFAAERSTAQQAARTRHFEFGSRRVDPGPWQVLERLAYRTYAPATEQSRAGAGSSTTDQD